MRLRQSETPRWAWFALAIGVVALALLVPRAVGVPLSSEGGPPEAIQSTEPAQLSPARARSAELRVVGDGWTAGSPDVDDPSATWTTALAAELAAVGAPVEISTAASTGAGYLQPDDRGRTFADLAAEGDGVAPDLLVYFGSESDVAPPEEVRAAAARTYELARLKWPEADVLAVGPAWPGASPPGTLLVTAAAVRAAAAAAGARFVDPIGEAWFAGGTRGLLDGATGYPTEEGQRHIARRLLPVVQELLADRPGAR